MKHYLLYVIIILFCNNNSFSQNSYIPFIAKDKYWFYSINYGDDFPQKMSMICNWFGGHTMINNINYTKLLKGNLNGQHLCPNPPCFQPYIPYEISSY